MLTGIQKRAASGRIELRRCSAAHESLPRRAAEHQTPEGVQRATQIAFAAMTHVKSKQRVADHGEVFTPPWLVESMLDLVKSESERFDSRFLEQACGSGNFLVEILRRKLADVEQKFRTNEFEKRHYAL